MTLHAIATELAECLSQLKIRVVFAESCTAGLVSASLARVSGVSDWHCGSAVTYRNKTKVDWLNVSDSTLEQHTAVSEVVAKQMALGVLSNTEEADISASVTGHLGPHAPARLDGVIYVAVARRTKRKNMSTDVRRFKLKERTRYKRQKEAAAIVLRCLLKSL